MKKTAAALMTAVMAAVCAASVSGSGKAPLDGTPYFYEKKDMDVAYTVYDKDGNIISDSDYDVIKPGGGRIIARMLSYGQRYGILDTDFNIILEPRFSQINYNENTKTFECLTWGEGPDKIEFFDTDMDPVPQPKDIRHLDGTDFYYERVIDEDAEINDGYISYYICDADGGRLSDIQYRSIKAVSGSIEVTDTNGVVNTYADAAQLVNRSSASAWARDSINTAVAAGIVPDELQGNYTDKINRREFCRLAVQTYVKRTGYRLDDSAESPFDDVSDAYVTAAYDLGIVSGTGANKFSPQNNITRQEAAVMLNNIAGLLGLKGSEDKAEFSDEGYFAQWAREAIYSITSVKSGDTCIMTGTEPNKFSPWMNYTREQAIATMLRLYSCKQAPTESDGQYKQPADGEWLYCEDSEYRTIGNTAYRIFRVKKDGSDMQVLLEANCAESAEIRFTDDGLIYYGIDGRSYKMKLDGSEKAEISSNEMNYAESHIVREAYDEKYKYFVKAYPSGMRSPDYCLTRSDLSGNNEVRLYDGYAFGEPVLYGGNIFIIACSDDGSKAILRFDKNGDHISITNGADNDAAEILKAENGTIYYRSRNEGGAIYRIGIDGSGNELIYVIE